MILQGIIVGDAGFEPLPQKSGALPMNHHTPKLPVRIPEHVSSTQDPHQVERIVPTGRRQRRHLIQFCQDVLPSVLTAHVPGQRGKYHPTDYKEKKYQIK